MNSEDINANQTRPLWFIDLDWYPQNNRSFYNLVQGRLCPKCRQRLKAEGGEVAASDLLATIQDCCSGEEGFITGELPILESIFRLFLANGNQPLELEEMSEQLYKWRGGDTYRTSIEMLSRLLQSDKYYGLRQIID